MLHSFSVYNILFYSYPLFISCVIVSRVRSEILCVEEDTLPTMHEDLEDL